MYFSAGVPSVTVQRQLSVATAAAAREKHPNRPSWVALFAKAYAMVAAEFPELRRAYVRLPWPHLYEYQSSAAQIAVERDFNGEKGLAFLHITDPAGVSLPWLSWRIRDAKQESEFGWKLAKVRQVARLPLPLRRALWWLMLNVPRVRANWLGTFGLSTVSSLDTEILNPQSPLSSVLTYGAVARDGSVSVRIVFDHRVMDAMTLARAFKRLEQVLNGPITDELRRCSDVVQMEAPSLAPAFPHQPVVQARR